MTSEISVGFVDFWPGFDPEDNRFTTALRTRRNVRVISGDSDDIPDILFYSRCGKGKHYRYDCLKIYYTGENDFPDFNECDYAISFYPYDCGGRNLRYPLFMHYDRSNALKPRNQSDIEATRRGFCSLVMSNSANCHPRRLEIIDAVESYKPIAYGGAFRNNTGGRVDDKTDFIGRYKFNLALENSSMPGYVTEKILESFAAGTVPIYWGDKAVKNDFNPESYINVGDYDSPESFLAALRRIDSNDSEYLAMLRAANGFEKTSKDFDNRLENFLGHIAANPVRIVQPYGEVAGRYKRNRIMVPLSYNCNFMRFAKLVAEPSGTMKKALSKLLGKA